MNMGKLKDIPKIDRPRERFLEKEADFIENVSKDITIFRL